MVLLITTGQGGTICERERHVEEMEKGTEY
jgi:hypothetical protein